MTKQEIREISEELTDLTYDIRRQLQVSTDIAVGIAGQLITAKMHADALHCLANKLGEITISEGV